MRLMEAADLPAVARLEEESFSCPWTEPMLQESLESPINSIFIMEENAVITGYALFSAIAEEGELLRIAVTRSLRGQGRGRKMLDEVEKAAREGGLKQIFLEVRSRNHNALALYQSAGFVPVSTRKNYYHSPEDDGIMMQKLLN